MTTKTIESASMLWEYMSSFKEEATCDAIVVCGSYDLRVCDYACGLLESGMANRLILSGNVGKWTKHLWDRPEAHVFRDRALQNGIDEKLVVVEDKASNFGENVRFSRALLPTAERMIFLTKPASVLRVKLTVEAQWPEVEGFVSCPDIRFPDDVSIAIGLWGVINEMVGDVDRIQKYPELGYQAAHQLPAEILDAWNYLIEQGFTYRLTSNRRPTAQQDEDVDIRIDGPDLEVESSCEEILRSLPEWFGNEMALLKYASETTRLPTFAAMAGDRAVGFLSLKEHFSQSWEIYCMAVHRDCRRQGYGKALLNHAENWLLEKGVRVLHVKTIGPSSADPAYAETREFYEQVGFTPVEEFPQLWSTANPCLQMVKLL